MRPEELLTPPMMWKLDGYNFDALPRQWIRRQRKLRLKSAAARRHITVAFSPSQCASPRCIAGPVHLHYATVVQEVPASDDEVEWEEATRSLDEEASLSWCLRPWRSTRSSWRLRFALPPRGAAPAAAVLDATPSRHLVASDHHEW